MKFRKIHLGDLPYCYAVSAIARDGRTVLLFASEERGPCYAFDAQTLEREVVWEQPGGTMSLVRLPDMNGDFLAIQGFYPGYDAAGTRIVHAYPRDEGWQTDSVSELPFMHRFDILERGGTAHLLACTLCDNKESEGDWSSPGGLYAAELPGDLTSPLKLHGIAGGMTRNHGYWRVRSEGFTSALTACDQGVFEVLPPAKPGSDWTVRKILEKPVSDIALFDIDGDGTPELAAIEPFHGDAFIVYREAGQGYEQIYRYPGELSFAHVVWGGRLRGEPVFIGGCRAGDRGLFLLHWRKGSFSSEVIDTGAGPSNIAVVNGSGHDLLAVANRETGSCDVYVVED